MKPLKALAAGAITLVLVLPFQGIAHAEPDSLSDTHDKSNHYQLDDSRELDPLPIGIDENNNLLKESDLDANRRDVTIWESPAYIPKDADQVPLLPNKSRDLISPNTVIGADGRYRITGTKAFPNRAVVYIERSGRAHCSGWMISADTLVTAGHCVYNRSAKDWYSGLKFYPGANGSSKPYGYATARQKWTDINYIKSGNVGQDWGIVKLNRRIGAQTGWFGLKWQTASYNGKSVTIKGYPGDKPAAQMWGMSGKIEYSKPNQLCYSIDTAGGQSGSPVYEPSTNQAIAIHAYGVGRLGKNYCTDTRNGATRITKSLFEFIMKVK